MTNENVANMRGLQRKCSQYAWFAYTGRQDNQCGSNYWPLSLTMNCGWRSIRVTYANLGRTASYAAMCPYPRNSSEDVTCVSSIADQISCEGQRWCQVNVAPHAIDPCPNTSKYAEVHYICQGKLQYISNGVRLLSMAKQGPG